MWTAIAKLLAVMTDPMLLIGTLVIWLSLKRYGLLAPLWVSIGYSVLVSMWAWRGSNGTGYVRCFIASALLTCLYWIATGIIARLRRSRIPVMSD
jgi:hypothetical protein